MAQWTFLPAPASLVLSACFFIGLPTAAVQAAQNTNQAAGEKPAKKSSSKPKNSSENRPAKVTFLPNSQEPTSVRNARLKRECKGRVNAGACAGFTH